MEEVNFMWHRLTDVFEAYDWPDEEEYNNSIREECENMMASEYIDEEPYFEDWDNDEVWAHIEEAPGYWISNHGRVWSDRRQQYMIPQYSRRTSNSSGVGRLYLMIKLRTNNGPKFFLIHRLIATYFISNPKNKPLVRHLNDDSLDNRRENLAWGTTKENMQDCMRNYGGRWHSCIKVKVINIHTNEELVFDSVQEAAKYFGINKMSIAQCIRRSQLLRKTYIFERI